MPVTYLDVLWCRSQFAGPPEPSPKSSLIGDWAPPPSAHAPTLQPAPASKQDWESNKTATKAGDKWMPPPRAGAAGGGGRWREDERDKPGRRDLDRPGGGVRCAFMRRNCDYMRAGGGRGRLLQISFGVEGALGGESASEA
eukprot:366000-Chlamydomonas_euryale.AAC.62